MAKVVAGVLGALACAWLVVFAVPAHPVPGFREQAPPPIVNSRDGLLFETHDADGANTMLPADQAIESAVGQVRPRVQPDSANSDRQFN